jgi:hypothetical protein
VKTRIALSILLFSIICGVAANPSKAATNCGWWQWRLTADNKTLNPVNGTIELETKIFHVWAINTSLPAGQTPYCTGTPDPSATASGSFGEQHNCVSCGTVVCSPIFTFAFQVPDNVGAVQMSWTNIGQDNEYQSSGGTCFADLKHTATVYCPTHSCNSTGCPVLLDTSGQGFFLTDAAHGVKFDIEANGNPIQMGWTAPGAANGFLALPALDGSVHNGSQLFGTQTPQPPSPNRNGFAALAVYDDPENGGNGDGVIDAKDAVYKSLRIWIDSNHDGVSQPEELHTLASLGIDSISLNYKEGDKIDQFGNAFKYWTQINSGEAKGSVGQKAVDVFFVLQ